MTSPTYRPRRTRHQETPPIVIVPTAETQAIYNQIREDEARHSQQHSLHPQDDPPDLLHPRDRRAPSMSRSPTTESHISGSLSPVSTTDQPESSMVQGSEVAPVTGRRPRGRRAGPLKLDKRFKTAIKRKLKFVCPQCKQKKVGCGHYDLSKFEESYQATRLGQAETSAPVARGALQAQVPRISPAPSDLFGLDNGGAFASPLPSVSDDFLELSGPYQRPNTRQQNLQNLVTSFDMNSLSLGTGTLETSFGQSYTPLFDTPSVPVGAISPPFPIGSEILGYESQWKCEYTSATGSVSSGVPDRCSWTGPLHDLERHFTSEHHAYQNEEFWCQCIICSSLSLGRQYPRQCTQENCYGGQWRRWCYGHYAVESTDASTPALTQSGESDGGYSFDPRNSGDQYHFGGQGNSRDSWGGYGGNGSGVGGGSGSTNTAYHFQCAEGSDAGGGKSYGELHSPVSRTTASAGISTPASAQHGKDFVECWPGRLSIERPRSSLELLRPRPCRKPRFRCPAHIRFTCVAVVCMLTMVTIGADISQLHEGSRARQDVEAMAVSRLSTIFFLGGFATTWLLKRWFADHNKTHACSRMGLYRASKVHSSSCDPRGSTVIATYHGLDDRPEVARTNETVGAPGKWYHDVSGDVVSMLCLVG